MRQLQLLLLGQFMLCFSSVKAQQAIVASGGEATGNGTLNYTVGQIANVVYSGTTGTVASGIQQAFEISSTITSVEDKAISLVEVHAYPNPTADFLTLIFENVNTLKHGSALLSDKNGRLIERIKIENTKTIIPMKDIAGTIFFLKIISDKGEIKTFKILKK